jgi:hypothetical protein
MNAYARFTKIMPHGGGMFYQPNDTKHGEEIDEMMCSLGKFIVEFERVCSSLQYLVIFILQDNGLRNQQLAKAVIGDKAAYELRKLFETIYQELPNQDADDKRAVKNLLSRFDRVTEFRNELAHANWSLEKPEEDTVFTAVLEKFKNKPSQGAQQKRTAITKVLIDRFALEARKQMVLMRRLSVSLLQSGFKTSVHMHRHTDCELEEGLVDWQKACK